MKFLYVPIVGMAIVALLAFIISPFAHAAACINPQSTAEVIYDTLQRGAHLDAEVLVQYDGADAQSMLDVYNTMEPPTNLPAGTVVFYMTNQTMQRGLVYGQNIVDGCIVKPYGYVPMQVFFDWVSKAGVPTPDIGGGV